LTGLPAPRIHPTALVEKDVTLGEGTSVWDSVHIRFGATIGKSCIVGEKTYIAYQVKIGDFVKINASVYICAEVEIGDFCMLSAHVVFTNDRFPRAGNLELTGLETSAVTEETLLTRLGTGVTVGANATIGPGLTLGEFSMVGMGSVVTADVAPFALVVGNPARQVAWVCACGHPLIRFGKQAAPQSGAPHCERCKREYALEGGRLRLTRKLGPIA
jgi:UDP-2-acetamido-3-amino-2,3-dideoxy-glucuronate N-acetyltransferase